MTNKTILKRRIIKTWQFWIPKMSFVGYSLFYLPKINRSKWSNSRFLVKLFYTGKGSFTYTMPKWIFPQVFKYFNLMIFTGNKKTRYILKPYFTSLVINLLGLTFRFKVFVRVKGLGYKAYVLNSGNTINLKLGLSHMVKFNFFRGMFATKLGQKDRMFSVEGNNWIMLTNTLARIRSMRKIDYYRGKGIFKKFYKCKIRVGKKKKNNANKYTIR